MRLKKGSLQAMICVVKGNSSKDPYRIPQPEARVQGLQAEEKSLHASFVPSEARLFFGLTSRWFGTKDHPGD